MGDYRFSIPICGDKLYACGGMWSEKNTRYGEPSGDTGVGEDDHAVGLEDVTVLFHNNNRSSDFKDHQNTNVHSHGRCAKTKDLICSFL